ncbi:MM3350-like domain-containing protein [Coniochaeta sp. 2T2.1]|nr:MM3350-like domain-containing protein [Coniochaeta sp. 2T2.1]
MSKSGKTTMTDEDPKACGNPNVWYCSPACLSADWPSHKTVCKRPNYIIKFHLCPGVIVDPPVIRTLSCPVMATMGQLHKALQIAFNWSDIHCYDFDGDDPVQPAPSRSAFIRGPCGPIAIPPAHWYPDWKETAENIPRYHLARVSDVLDGRPDFRLEALRVQPTTVEVRTLDSVKLYEFIEHPLFDFPVNKISYNYDYLREWKHIMTVEGVDAAATEGKFVCISGEGHYVAEGTAGPLGWQDLKACFRALSPTFTQKSNMDWYETTCVNGEPQGLKGRDRFFDKSDVHRRLAAMQASPDELTKTMGTGRCESAEFILPVFFLFAPELDQRNRAKVCIQVWYPAFG